MNSKRQAIALKYMEGTEAPVILAKGQGRKADLILSEAEKNAIPIREDKLLVDMLGIADAGEMVPENTWQALAVIFSYILNDEKSGKVK